MDGWTNGLDEGKQIGEREQLWTPVLQMSKNLTSSSKGANTAIALATARDSFL